MAHMPCPIGRPEWRPISLGTGHNTVTVAPGRSGWRLPPARLCTGGEGESVVMGENVSLRALADFAGRAMGALGIIRGLREAAGGGDRESSLAEDRGRETRGKRKRTGRKSRAKRLEKRLRRDARKCRERAIRAEEKARRLEARLREKVGQMAQPDRRRAGRADDGQATAGQPPRRQAASGEARRRGKNAATDMDVAAGVREGLLAAATLAEALTRAGWTPPPVTGADPSAKACPDARHGVTRRHEAPPELAERPRGIHPETGLGIESGESRRVMTPEDARRSTRSAARRARRAERRRHEAEEAFVSAAGMGQLPQAHRECLQNERRRRVSGGARSLPCSQGGHVSDAQRPLQAKRTEKPYKMYGRSTSVMQGEVSQTASFREKSGLPRGNSSGHARGRRGQLRREDTVRFPGHATMPGETGRRHAGWDSLVHSQCRTSERFLRQSALKQRHRSGIHRTARRADARWHERAYGDVPRTDPRIEAMDTGFLSPMRRLAAAVLLTPQGRPMRNLLRLPTLGAATLQDLRL